MNIHSGRAAMVAILLTSVMLAACGSTAPTDNAGSEGSAAADYERGPHRGRLLRDGAFALELQIYEEGVPPEFHVYLYQDDQPLASRDAVVSVELHRLDGEVNRFSFEPQKDYLRGSDIVHEPHSFSVVVEAQAGRQSHRWTYDSFEGRTQIEAETAEAAGIRTEAAGPATIADTLVLTGRLVPNAERSRSIAARFPGPIREVLRSVGESVKAGERLAMVESNESLKTFAVTAPIDGVITERHANPGETAGSEPLFVVVDYRQLWAELSLFPRDLARVKPGQRVKLTAVDGAIQGEGRIVRVAPAETSQAAASAGIYTARVAIDNSDRRWAPGLYVEGQVRIAETAVPLAVKRSGLQGFRDFTVVFERVGTTYEVRMLELGRQDDTWVEVTGGLKPGVQYVAENSYLIKADIEKSGASHDH